MSFHPKHPKTVSAAAALATFLLGGTILWACGPFIPDWLLGDDKSVLATPTTRFDAEAKRLVEKLAGGQTDSGAYEQTAEADLADLAEALAAARVPADRSAALIGEVRALREILTPAGEDAPESSPLAATQVPAGLPPEFDLYLRGAAAYHQGRLDDARRQWEALLARPSGERRFRSTWAAFMLGKASLASDPEAAARWFAKTREIAGQKSFRDSLGLAASSLGWEARAALDRGRFARAIVLYAEQSRSGDPGALLSLRFACRQALDSSPEALLEVARDAKARPFLTALVLARSEDYDENGTDAKARGWLAAVEKAGVTRDPEADRLAWTAYRAADFDAAERWLARADKDSPIAKWIRARLLLRRGEIPEAERLLAQVSKEMPDAGIDRDEGFLLMFDVGDPVATPLRAAGEAGAAALAEKEYIRSLGHLLAGGYWRDAAYVAERVLTLDELKAYVDAHVPGGPVPPKDPDDWSVNLPGLVLNPPEEQAQELRYLLARRLIRAGRYDDAKSYLPEERQEGLRDLAAAIHEGRDPQRTKEERASDLFRAACIERWQGMELLGTEVAPDWAEFDGQYALTPTLKDRTDREEGSRLGPSADEVERARRHAVSPDKRFHYRYVAADLGWQAAALLPDGSPEKARFLAASGSWIKDRDPKAAQRFFKELVHCCGETELGREATALAWFPEVDGCGPEEE